MTMSILTTTVAGTVVGTGYAIALRAWMRLVTTDPEFTWSGTGYIVGAFAVLGTLAGLTSAGRSRGWGTPLVAVRTFGIVLSLGCFVAAGAMMAPTIIPAALGMARRDWPRAVRAGLVLIGAVAAVAIVVSLPGLDPFQRRLGLLIYLLLCPIEVALMALLYAPAPKAGSNTIVDCDAETATSNT